MRLALTALRSEFIELEQQGIRGGVLTCNVVPVDAIGGTLGEAFAGTNSVVCEHRFISARGSRGQFCLLNSSDRMPIQGLLLAAILALACRRVMSPLLERARNTVEPDTQGKQTLPGLISVARI